MKKFILVSDSFKGTLDAAQVCQIQENTIHRLIPDAQVRSIPMADGGEGMVDSYLYIMGGQRKTVTVRSWWWKRSGLAEKWRRKQKNS